MSKEKRSKGYVWCGVRLTKIQTTTRPDQVWPEVWTKIGEAVQNLEKQKNLIYRFRWRRISRNSQQCKAKTGQTMAPVMQRKRPPNSITKVAAKQESGCEKNPQTVYGWKVESHESSRQRWNFVSPKIEDFDVTLQFGAQVLPDATSDENSGCKSRSGQEMEKA